MTDLNKLNKGELYEYKLTNYYGFKWYKDKIKWNEGSDIETLKMSVKFKRASIYSTNENVKASQCNKDKLESMIAYYISNVASEKFAYGIDLETSYLMDKAQFKAFLMRYATLDNDSTTKKEKLNGLCGKLKLRLKDIPVKEVKWLEKNSERINL